MPSDTRKVTICAVPHEMTIVDGHCVLFSNKSGFYGLHGRVVFTYIQGLWYITDMTTTFDKIAAAHIVAMHRKLKEHIGGDHELGLDDAKNLKWKDVE